MREIKFRGKSISTGEWVYGYYYKFESAGKFFHNIYRNNDQDHFVFPESVGEFTGLKDENDKEAFENDLVEFAIFDYNDSDTQYKGVIKFSDGQWQLWNTPDNPYFGSDGPFLLHLVWRNDDSIRILGNTYDNSGLLTKAENDIITWYEHGNKLTIKDVDLGRVEGDYSHVRHFAREALDEES